jgi:hypothetical protein
MVNRKINVREMRRSEYQKSCTVEVLLWGMEALYGPHPGERKRHPGFDQNLSLMVEGRAG